MNARPAFRSRRAPSSGPAPRGRVPRVTFRGAASQEGVKPAVFGLSISSSWGNGHAARIRSLGELAPRWTGALPPRPVILAGVAKSPEPSSPLVLAAQELEDELRRCEKALEEASRLRLNSEKNISRAAHALKTASEDRERMAGKVQALLAAINGAQGRMQEGARRMEARAVELQERMTRLEKVQAVTAEVGSSVRELTEFARGVKDPRQILERLGPVEQRVAQAFEEARAEGFEDVAHDVASMRDLLATQRKKLEAL